MRKISKFMSLVLRHDPQAAGLSPDPAGWVMIDDLLAGLARHDLAISRQELEALVTNNDKKRFTLSEDGQKIRAAQGHSINVNLGYTPQTPPDLLYHGTAEKTVPFILKEGLTAQSRLHVHLSSDTETATKVGMRHGRPQVLIIDTKSMHADGYVFYLSDNQVWLTNHVPVRYIST